MGPLLNNLSSPYPHLLPLILPLVPRSLLRLQGRILLRLGSLPPARRTIIPKLTSKILIPDSLNLKIIYNERESYWSKINQSRNEVWLCGVGLNQSRK